MAKKTTNDVMTLAQWYKKYDKIAKRQGWSLWTRDGEGEHSIVSLQRVDEQGADADTDKEEARIRATHTQLDSDDQAITLVVHQAAAGCVMSLLALWWDGRELPKNDNTEVWIPKPLRRGRVLRSRITRNV